MRSRKTRELVARLKILRGFRNLSQARLADAAGLSRQYVSSLEQGKRPRPREGTLLKLAGALGVTPAQLKGCAPIPEVLAALADAEADVAEASEAAAAAETVTAAAPDALPDAADTVVLERAAPARGAAVGLTTLLTLPPGATLIQRTLPDGTVYIYIKIPGGPPDEGASGPPRGALRW